MGENNEKNIIADAISESIIEASKLNYTPIYCAAYGSQNYNLDVNDDEYQSDIDTKLIIIPSLDDLIHNSEPVSKVINISTGQCDIKDIRSFVNVLNKANVQFLETLCTDHFQYNMLYEEEILWMRNNLNNLARECRDALMKSSYGMATQKYTAMCHRYPSIEWKIDKWGYDGKQLHHIIRLYDFLVNFITDGKSFKQSMVYEKDSERAKYLIDIKKNMLDKSTALKLADEYCEKIKMLVDDNLGYDGGNNYKNGYLKKSYDMIRKAVKNSILEEYDGTK
mgnify:CR=1 FL=1